MSKRIQEIAGQVLDEVVPETWTRLDYDKIKEIQLRTAELTIKECALVVARANNALGRNIDKLFEMHFGSKE